MEVGRFFYSEDTIDNVFYYKDIYLVDQNNLKQRKTGIEKYPIKLIFTDDEIVFVHNRIHVKVLTEDELKEANDNDKHKLNITARQFIAFSIPYKEQKIKVADKRILKMYNPKNHFKLNIDIKEEKDNVSIKEGFFEKEFYDEGYNYFWKKDKKVIHTFSNLKSFGVKKMYKRNKLKRKQEDEIRLKIPYKRILLEFLYDYHFMNIFQDALPKEKVEQLDSFFHKSVVVKGISLKFKLLYLKGVLIQFNKKNKQKENYGSQEYEKLLKSWRKLILSSNFEEIDNKFYGKDEWFDDSEKEIFRVHKKFLPLLENLKKKNE